MKVVGGRRVFSLGEVSGAIARRFEDVPSLWMEAEIRDLRSRRAQVWFRLADGEESIAASMNAIVFGRLARRPEDGTRVHAYGRVTFYRRRGELSLRVERLEETGEGLLRARIAELKARLAADGLLDPARRRRLPMLPRRVGLVASADGSAWHDVIVNARARFPEADIVAADALVQGDGAPASIVAALKRVQSVDVDVVVLARGGGSLEDLMAFNSEDVCRAVAASLVPVVSAVGHEDDLTLCDEVADLRVSTPTKAAEAVFPDREALDVRLASADTALLRGLERAATQGQQALTSAASALAIALRARGRRGEDRLGLIDDRMGAALRRAVVRSERDLGRSGDALERCLAGRVGDAVDQAARLARMLELLSPERTVGRGYAIVRDSQGAVVAHVDRLTVGDPVAVDLRDGRADATITGIER